MSEYTKGPWRMNGPTGPNMRSYSQPFCVAGTGEEACTLIAGCFGDTKGGVDAAKANALLIAAAPALLEALEELAELASPFISIVGEPDELINARAAIKLAKGEA